MRRGHSEQVRRCSPVTCGDWVEYQQEKASPAAGSPSSTQGRSRTEEENVCGSVSFHVPGHVRLIALMAAWT